METKCGAEIEGKATQRLSYPGIHPINSHQTPTLLRMTRSAYQKEPVMVVSGGALPEPYTYRAANHWTGCGVPMDELQGGLEELKGLQPHGKNNDVGHPDPPRTPRD